VSPKSEALPTEPTANWLEFIDRSLNVLIVHLTLIDYFHRTLNTYIELLYSYIGYCIEQTISLAGGNSGKV
jgi:hypothetical protein